MKFENSHSRLFQKRFGARSEWITSSCVNFWNVLITNFDFWFFFRTSTIFTSFAFNFWTLQSKNLRFFHSKLHWISLILSSLPYAVNYVYFWFSLLYLFGRTLTAQYLAALIHETSNRPLNVLKAVPYNGWCIKIQRFIDQIRSQTMAFSGYKFFYLTRKSIIWWLIEK